MTASFENITDVEMLKTAIIKAMEERPDLFKQLFKEVLLENKSLSEDKEAAQLEAIESIVSRDFKRFDKVFKALA